MSTKERFERLSRVRGLMVGLALGDALARVDQPDGWLRGTATTQLACFTTEGLIRAWVRGESKGICHPPSVVWNAYRRWAAVQDLDLQSNNLELDGWLHQVPALHERRGKATEMVVALRAADGSAPIQAPEWHRDHHALTRLLPAAVLPDSGVSYIEEMASAAHGYPGAITRSVLGVAIARASLTARSLEEAITAAGADLLWEEVSGATLVEAAPSDSARSALRGGLLLASACGDPVPSRIEEVLTEARDVRAPDAVGSVAGALIGALHGVEALPVHLLSRLELGWVVDTLARDLVCQFEDHPASDGYSDAADPHWHDRYPSW